MKRIVFARRSSGILILAASMCLVRGGDRFGLSMNQCVLPEMGTVTRCQLSTDKGVYRFMPPFNWRIEVDSAEKKINLTSQEGSLITLRSIDTGNGEGATNSLESVRDSAIRQSPTGKIIEEFSCYSGAAAGKAFDVELETSVGAKLISRLVLIPVKGETIEFRLVARSDRFHDESVTLSSLLTSFQLTPLKDKTIDQ